MYEPPTARPVEYSPASKWGVSYSLFRALLAITLGVILIETVQLIPNEIAKQVAGNAKDHEGILNFGFVAIQIPSLLLVNILVGYLIATIARRFIIVSIALVTVEVVARELILYYYPSGAPIWYHLAHLEAVAFSIGLGAYYYHMRMQTGYGD